MCAKWLRDWEAAMHPGTGKEAFPQSYFPGMVRMAVRTRKAKKGAKNRAAALLALGQVAKKDANSNLLNEGESCKVEGTFSGDVDGEPVEIQIGGLLQIGHDGTRSKTSNPDLSKLLAIILAKVPKTRRADILDVLPREYSERKTLPEADAELVEAAATLLNSLRSRSTSHVKGSVTFSRDL